MARGINPLLLKRAAELPDHFPVTDAMLGGLVTTQEHMGNTTAFDLIVKSLAALVEGLRSVVQFVSGVVIPAFVELKAFLADVFEPLAAASQMLLDDVLAGVDWVLDRVRGLSKQGQPRGKSGVLGFLWGDEPGEGEKSRSEVDKRTKQGPVGAHSNAHTKRRQGILSSQSEARKKRQQALVSPQAAVLERRSTQTRRSVVEVQFANPPEGTRIRERGGFPDVKVHVGAQPVLDPGG